MTSLQGMVLKNLTNFSVPLPNAILSSLLKLANFSSVNDYLNYLRIAQIFPSIQHHSPRLSANLKSPPRI